MRYTYIYIVFQFLVIQASAQADSLAGLNANTLKNLAKNAERLGDVYSSIGYFEAYTAKRGKDVEARYSLGKLYEASRNYDAAAQTYERVFLDAAEKYPEALYDQGRMQMMLGQYAAAKISFNQFISVIKKTDKRSLAKTAAIDMAGCDSAEILLSKPLNIEVKNLGSPFNSKHIDFSPLLLDDTHMIYGSLREEEIKYYDEGLPRPQRQFYTAEKKDGKWVNTGLLEGPVNDPKVHTGNGAISTDGERLYFTRCESDWKNNVRCALWVAKKAGNSWLEPEKLNEQINLPDYSSTQPAIGTESKKGLDVIYFVSNRPGGQGGNDIWFTVYDAKKNTYKEPLNAGKTINSERNETTPFYVDSEKKMYFSTDGKAGLGGLDIFSSRGEMKTWTPPVNAGVPINSSTDDLYYILDKSGKEGFLVSNRPGGNQMFNSTCCDDIYSFHLKNKLDLAIQGIVMNTDQEKYLNGLGENMPDASSDKGLEGVKVELYVQDRGGQQVLVKQQELGKNGEYFLPLEQDNDYRITFSKDGYFNNEINISTRNLAKSDTLVRHLGMSELNNEKSYVIEYVEFEYNSADLTPKAKEILDGTLFQVMKENELLIIEISAHTDNKGTDEYNMKLSQQRAESVANYLANKGIDKKRMKSKGYGESRPIAPNENPDGSDNPEGRQRNRRTEFKVLGELEPAPEASDPDDE